MTRNVFNKDTRWPRSMKYINNEALGVNTFISVPQVKSRPFFSWCLPRMLINIQQLGNRHQWPWNDDNTCMPVIQTTLKSTITYTKKSQGNNNSDIWSNWNVIAVFYLQLALLQAVSNIKTNHNKKENS